MTDSSKSIEQLENDVWETVEFPTELVEKCYAYRKIPVQDLTGKQLRVLISQAIGIPFILSKTIAILKSNILIEVEYFPGDLLSTVLKIPNWPDTIMRNDFKIFLQDQIDSVRINNHANELRQIVRDIDQFISVNEIR
jgi:hypothetical protein